MTQRESKANETPTPITAVVEEIEELLKIGSPGNWSACNDGNCSCGFVWSESADSCLFKAFTEWGDGPGMIYGANTKEARTANMQLICLLRNNIESLLAERKRHIEALEKIASSSCEGMSLSMTEVPTIGTDVCRHHIANQALSPAGENGGKGHE